MRINKERHESTIRVTKIEVAIHEALRPFVPEDDHDAILDLEVLEALARVSSSLTGELRRAQVQEPNEEAD